ncbi:MAG: T9SS type A sorting domain-containing protein [Bacteroidia bacterium]|nr:T9SS type A sorting domain-containing protein [Bacteroidia bacterium]
MNRKSLFLLLVPAIFLLQRSVTSAQILVHGGFENWSVGPSGYLDPDGWYTDNNTSFSPYVIQAPGRTGLYSANLISVLIGSGSYFGGSVAQDHYGPLGNNSISLTGYWKGNFTGTNNHINISIYAIDGASNVLAQYGLSGPSDTNLVNWTPFNFPLGTFQINLYMISINFVLFSTSANTSGFIDDVDLIITTGANEIGTNHLLNSYIFPDQTGNNFLNLNLPTPTSFTTTIFSVDGKNVFSQNYSLAGGEHKILLPTQNLSEGIYFCHIAGEEVNRTFKFIKQ